jgi:O-acetyl-ADP-ribose deacetylase (regulator of RNase III)
MAAWDNPFEDSEPEERSAAAPQLVGRWLASPAGGPPTATEDGPLLAVTLSVGDLTASPAAAVCTSTNPRLSLLAGTGAEVVRQGGWEVKRQADAAVERERARTGRAELDLGSVHPTSAGRLPFRLAIHCVASNVAHRSSAEVVRSCVLNALAAADAAGCASVAMPIFGSGHAALPLDVAVTAMATALRDAGTAVEEVALVIDDASRARTAGRVLDSVLTSA